MIHQTRESSELSLFVYPDETIDDLQRDGLRMIQKKDGFRFGEDSVLLAAFAADLAKPVNRKGQMPMQIADIGAGSGTVSLLLAGRLPRADIVGIEISQRPYEIFLRNITLNGLDGRVRAIRGDVRETSLIPRASLDLIVSNPPYRHAHRHLKKPASGQASLDDELRTAQDMTTLSPDDLTRTAASWLKPGGTIALIQRPENLPELLNAMHNARIEPTLLRPVVPLPGRKPSAILVAGRLHGLAGSFRFLPELLVCDRPGHYSPETAAIYGVSADE
ncbi:MAG: methyltransferase [Eubacteriales bacterium]|nr:methyltransferase [Eubacteriales bacterium]